MQRIPAVVLFLVLAQGTAAQHVHMHKDSSDTQEMHGMEMPSSILLTVPMTRDGSGTSWHPDSSPTYAFHLMSGGWRAMIHGSIFGRYTAQDVAKRGSRGSSSFSAPNWFMGMLSHDVVSDGQISFRAMLSFDRLTEGGGGYPLLLQSGESWNGKRLVDQQHPHDLLMELSAAYSHVLSPQHAVYAYLAYPGEPALGPPTYMHRPSAWDNVNAPLGHHWQDASHITFGVATLGYQYGDWKIEGSVFTGREPDENRFDFDRPRFDSYSARLSFNPSPHWALQISRGYLKQPELLEPGVDQFRTTASILYHYVISPDQYWASAVVWGVNTPIGEHSLHSFLIESNVDLGMQSIFGRIEMIQKSAVDLDLPGGHERRFVMGAVSLGTARDLLASGALSLALGLLGTFYQLEEALRPVYGSQPFSMELFLRLSPSLLKMDGTRH